MQTAPQQSGTARHQQRSMTTTPHIKQENKTPTTQKRPPPNTQSAITTQTDARSFTGFIRVSKLGRKKSSNKKKKNHARADASTPTEETPPSHRNIHERVLRTTRCTQCATTLLAFGGTLSSVFPYTSSPVLHEEPQHYQLRRHSLAPRTSVGRVAASPLHSRRHPATIVH
ncbi:unnamed protein product [Ectocarpus sp. 12 AP-2014]